MTIKYILILVSSFFLFNFIIGDYSFVSGQDSNWEIGQPMPTNRTEITSEVIDGNIYVLGGADYLKDGIMNVIEVYDPQTKTWSKAPPTPISIDHTASVSYNGKLYLVGGFLEDKTPTDRLFIYDPYTNNWSEGNPLPSPRGALAAEVIDGNIYAIGGVNSTHDPVATNEVYNIKNNTWTTNEPLSKPRHHIASAVVDEKIYILGGRLLGNGEPSEINEALTNMDDNSMYDPKSNTWMELEPMQLRRSGFTASELNGQIFVFGGQTPQGATDKVERYDPIVNQWFPVEDMKYERSGATSKNYNDRIYVIGGQQEGLKALNVNEILNIGNNTSSNSNG
jgi:N-acetylneuraminic acid mutarotase